MENRGEITIFQGLGTWSLPNPMAWKISPQFFQDRLGALWASLGGRGHVTPEKSGHIHWFQGRFTDYPLVDLQITPW